MSDITFRHAEKNDVPAIVAMLSDDDIGESRESAAQESAPVYVRAFEEMNACPDNYILLAEIDGQLVGSLQLVFIPGLSRQGVKRAIIEAVRVKSAVRGQSIGTALMKRAIAEAREAGCKLVQLTSDRRRTRAHLFYRRLGFEQSHVGFKLGSVMAWAATVLTLFPEMFPGPLGASLLGKAHEKNLWSLETRDIREHGLGKHRQVDDTPSGGGPGMVMRADVACAAIDAVERHDRPLIYLSPRGAPLTQARVRALSDGPGAILLCGRFEGLDQRANEARSLEEISLGDFVLAGGEIAAMALIEACVRLIPGVLGADASPTEESFENGLLEYPQYTRPQSFEGHEIPAVLTGGNHAEIARWRKSQSEALTRTRRPDLWTHYEKAKL